MSKIGSYDFIDIETGLIAWHLPTQSSNIINESYSLLGKKTFFRNCNAQFWGKFKAAFVVKFYQEEATWEYSEDLPTLSSNANSSLR